MSTPAHRAQRLPGLDATRAIALIGVVAMNYHGYLNGGNAAQGTSFLARLFDPWEGVLSTRFAATFVTLAGVGIVLLTNASRTAGDREAVREDRWRLRRRGVVLLAFGYTFEWIWAGTILYFYGAYFIVASFLFTWRIRWLALSAAAVGVASAGFAWYGLAGRLDNDPVTWLTADAYTTRSHKDLVLYTVFNGTHPLLPWLAFLFVGMIIGRLLPHMAAWRWRLVALGGVLLAVGYIASAVLKRTIGLTGRTLDNDDEFQAALRWQERASTSPFSRGLLYTVTTIGSSVVAVCLLTWLFDGPLRRLGRLLAPAGQTTLTLYVVHSLVFNWIVNQRQWVTPTGLDTAWLLTGGFWVAGIAFAWCWNRTLGLGPLERIYRRFS